MFKAFPATVRGHLAMFITCLVTVRVLLVELKALPVTEI
jgi:hypothetical protein